MSAFEIRGYVITEQRAKKFRDTYTGDDWRGQLVAGMNNQLFVSKKPKLNEKELFAYRKWLDDISDKRRMADG